MIKGKQYTTDLGEAEWVILGNWFEKVEPKRKCGQKRSHDLRELVNAVRYVLRKGCTWRDLPGDFPAWQSVYYHYRNWRKEGLWQKPNKYLRRTLRQQLGRNEEASARVVSIVNWSKQAVYAIIGWMEARKPMPGNDIY